MLKQIGQTLGICAAVLLAAPTFCAASDASPILRYSFDRTLNNTARRGAFVPALKLSGDAKCRKLDGKNALVFNGKPDCFAESDNAAEFRDWNSALKMRELAGGFFIRFSDGLFGKYRPAREYTLGLFDCSLDAAGKILLRLPVRPGEIGAKEFTLHGRDKIEFNRWYHIEFNYSMNRRRATLYVDGRLQQDMVLPLPEQLRFAPLKMGVNFDGAVADLRLYDAPLNSEDLLPFLPDEKVRTSLRSRLTAASATAPKDNGEFRDWIASVEKNISDYEKDPGLAVVSDWRRIENDTANAEKIASLLASGNGLKNGKLACWEVGTASQEMLTPRRVPEEGRFTDTIRIIVAKDEFESASFLLFAFQNVGKLTFEVSDLKSADASIPASELDLRLVKRWFRSGGAWMSYHADKYQRLLVPDLLLKDENMIRVDESRRTNELRLTYPDRTVYADVSQFSKDNDPRVDPARLPLNDAKTLQPIRLDAGRTQQMWLTLHVPKRAPAGVYEGTIQIFADGKPVGTLKLQTRVLPFELPVAKTYYDTGRDFFSWLTGGFASDPAYAEKQMKFLAEHGMRHYQGIDWSSEEAFLKSIEMRKKYGLANDFFMNCNVGAGGRFYNSYAPHDTAAYEKAKADKKQSVEKQIGWVRKHLGHENLHFYGNDEAAGYWGLRVNQEPFWIAVREAGGKISGADGTSSFEQVADLQNVLAITENDSAHARKWHSVGGRCLNYADPFSGAENPLIFRRKCGLLMYKNNYDGWFLLSFTNWRVPWNEFAADPGGDGNYRHFGMTYPAQSGPVDTMAMCALREAMDDVRYATLLKTQALRAAASPDLELEREGKRQLAWLERLDAGEADPDDARLSMIRRILILQELMKIRGAK